MFRRTHGTLPVRRAMSRLDVMCLFGLFGVLIWMMARHSVSTRRPARRMECQNNLKQIALASHQYATANQGRLPFLADERFGWPIDLLPYLDCAALHRAIQTNRHVIDEEWTKTKKPLTIKVFVCPVDPTNVGQHVGLSYVGNAGWGDFRVDQATEAVFEKRLHFAELDWDRDGEVSLDEMRRTRATGLFWRSHADGFQLTLEAVADADGQSATMLFSENSNARNWLSRETFDIGFVVGRDHVSFGPLPQFPSGLKITSANLGAFGIRDKPRSLPGHSPVPSSHHPGLFNVAFVDGRVEWRNVNIDPRVYLQLMTWDGQRWFDEPVGIP